MWLTMMIEHHEGAVEMAQDVLATTSNPEVEKLATAVVEGQENETPTMKGMLGCPCVSDSPCHDHSACSSR